MSCDLRLRWVIVDDLELGRWVQRRRAQLRLTQGDLVKRLRDAGLSWSQGTLSRVENGDRPIRAVELEALATALDSTIADFLAGDHHPLDELINEYAGAAESGEEELEAARQEVRTLEEGLTLSRTALQVITAVRSGDIAAVTNTTVGSIAEIVPMYDLVTLLQQAGATDDEISTVIPEAFGNSPRARIDFPSKEMMAEQVAPLLRKALGRKKSGEANG